MEENDFWYKFWTRAVAPVLISLIVSIAAYNVVDRIYQGHTVIVTVNQVVPTK